MDNRRLDINRAYLAATVGAVALTLLLVAASPASAGDDCPVGAPGIAICGAAPELAEDLSRRRVNRTLATNPAADRLNRLDGSAASDTTTPFAMTPEGDNANFNTSLTQWSAALSAAELEKLKKAKEAAGEDLALPKQVKAPTKFDLWAKGRSESFSEYGAAEKEGGAVTTYVGADYRMSRDFLFGGLVQFDESRQTIVAAPDAIDGKAFMAGPYMAYRLNPHVVVDAKAAWGNGQDSAMAGDDSVHYSTARMLSEAKVKGSWVLSNWQLSQMGAVTYLDETSSSDIGGIAGASVDVTRLSMGPELKRQFATGNGGSVEPFAFFKSSLDLSDVALPDSTTFNTVGGGVVLAKPENFNIRAQADYTESTDDISEPEARGKVSVSVPSSLFGF